MTDKVDVRDVKPDDDPSDLAASIVSRMEKFENTMKEERQAEEAKLRQEIEDLKAKVAAARAFHVQDDKQQVASPARIVDAILKARNGRPDPWKDAGYELEVITAHEGKRTMSAGSDTAGGYWVPEEFLGGEFIENLRASTVIYGLGARELSGLMGSPVVIPRKTGSSTGYWVGENVAITASDLTAGQINMEPHAVAAVVQMSNRLRMLANPSVEAMVNADISQTLGLKIERAALRGPEGTADPMGILLTKSINTTSTASINVTNALAMLYELEVDNAAFGALGFLMHPRVWNTVRGRYRTKHTEFQGVKQAGPDAAIPTDLAGYQVARSTQVRADASSTSDVYFGNWNDLIVGRWGGISFDVTTEASDGTNHAFMQNQFWVRAIAEVDVAVRRAESFCVNISVTD